MPALSQDRELDQLLAEAQPDSRFQDLAIWFRRLTVECDQALPDQVELTAPDGTKIRIRNAPGGIACGSNPPGRTAQLQDGTPLRWEGGVATLRVEVVARFGGRWDHLEHRFVQAPPERPMHFDLQESQVAFTRWFAAWWSAFRAGRPREHSAAVLLDDRAGGKTLICWLLLLAASLDCPRHSDGAEFVCWAVSKNHTEREELDRELRTWLPPSWYRLVLAPKPYVYLATGATVWLRSADDPETLKQGRVDLFWINEGAKMDSRPFENAIPRTRDREGLCIIATNPPTAAYPPGAWISDLWEKSEEARASGEPNPVAFLRCSSSLNVAISKEAGSRVSILLRWVNPERAAADIDGLILPVGRYAYRPPFNPAEHVRVFDPAEWAHQDITKALTAKLSGQPAEWVLGHDFQFDPGNAAVALKAYGSLERPVFWVHADFLEEGDENELLSALEADLEWVTHHDFKAEPRFAAGNTVSIGDPSGSWQNYAHDKGKDSFAVFKARGWRLLPPIKAKDRDTKPPHPPVHLRIARLNSLVAGGRLFIAKGPNTDRIALSLRKCKVKRGTLGRFKPTGDEAHLTDALGYAIWWMLPRFIAPLASRQVARSLGTGWRRR